MCLNISPTKFKVFSFNFAHKSSSSSSRNVKKIPKGNLPSIKRHHVSSIQTSIWQKPRRPHHTPHPTPRPIPHPCRISQKRRKTQDTKNKKIIILCQWGYTGKKMWFYKNIFSSICHWGYTGKKMWFYKNIFSYICQWGYTGNEDIIL